MPSPPCPETAVALEGMDLEHNAAANDAANDALGANAGIGISLGDDCVVEAGCYITGGSRVQLPDGSVMKAKELSGKNGILFRRDSQSGALHAIPRNKSWGELNAELHKN